MLREDGGDVRDDDLADAEFPEHNGGRRDLAAGHDLPVAETGEPVVIGIEVRIDFSVAAEGVVREFADEVERDAAGAEPVLQRLPPAAAVFAGAPGRAAVMRSAFVHGEIGSAGDAVAERQDAKHAARRRGFLGGEPGRAEQAAEYHPAESYHRGYHAAESPDLAVLAARCSGLVEWRPRISRHSRTRASTSPA